MNTWGRTRSKPVTLPASCPSCYPSESHGTCASLNTHARRNILFVCSKNQWRSPTAEQIWRKHPLLSVRSGGTSPNARHAVSVEDIRWADVILVMEEKHKSRLVAEFNRLLEGIPIHVLDIANDYKYMDVELIEQLEQSVNALLDLK